MRGLGWPQASRHNVTMLTLRKGRTSLAALALHCWLLSASQDKLHTVLLSRSASRPLLLAPSPLLLRSSPLLLLPPWADAALELSLLLLSKLLLSLLLLLLLLFLLLLLLMPLLLSVLDLLLDTSASERDCCWAACLSVTPPALPFFGLFCC